MAILTEVLMSRSTPRDEYEAAESEFRGRLKGLTEEERIRLEERLKHAN